MATFKFVTFDQVKSLYKDLRERLQDKLTSKENAEVSSITIDNTSDDQSVDIEYDSENRKVIFSESDPTLGGSISLPIPDADNDYTAATLEDETQELKIKELTSGGFITKNDSGKATYYAFPNAALEFRTKANRPQGVGVMPGSEEQQEISGGGGVILTSRYRSYDQQILTINIMQPRSFSVSSSVYTIINFNEDSIPQGENIHHTQYISLSTAFDGRPCDHWLEINIPNNISSINLDIKMFFLTSTSGRIYVKWVGGEPMWSKLGGRTVQIHVINKIATWGIVGDTGGQVSPTMITASDIIMMTVAGMGPIDDAKQYAHDNNYSRFQWILEARDGNDNKIVKPIWFTGTPSGGFIDALGYVICSLAEEINR